ncbi:MAG TPA: polysaccharide deacetylase family protein [Chthoniobacteraceae bacterium]|nr:polysaccharide deacetylase family protein [Chthoniobacteraceae bacterium]
MKIAQCWDDGVHDDIRVIEILQRHGAKATFNLNAGKHHARRVGHWKERFQKEVQHLALPELRSVYDGFLIANHTFSHPRLTQLPLEAAREEIRTGKDALEQIFGYEITGFTYPFGDYNDAVEALVQEAGHLYARTTKTIDRITPGERPMAFHPNCHFRLDDFWSRFEAVQREDGVFYFWGHSYELCTEEQWRTFDEQIRRLSQAGEWIDLPELFAPAAPQG